MQPVVYKHRNVWLSRRVKEQERSLLATGGASPSITILGAAVTFMMSFENFNTTLFLGGSEATLPINLYLHVRDGSAPVLHGRRESGGDWDLPAELGAEILVRFIRDFETTHCGALRDRFGEEAQMEECGKLVKGVAGSLMALLAEKRDGSSALCRDRKTCESSMKKAA